MDGNQNKFDVEEMVKEVYTKIATWHNEEANELSLKHLSFEIVSDIIEKSFSHFGIKVNFSVDMNDEIRDKIKKSKKFN